MLQLHQSSCSSSAPRTGAVLRFGSPAACLEHLSTSIEPHDAVCHVLSAKQCRHLHQISTAITLYLAWTFACHLSLRGGRYRHPRAACHGGQESRTVTKLECQLADKHTQKVLKSSVLRESKQMPGLSQALLTSKQGTGERQQWQGLSHAEGVVKL